MLFSSSKNIETIERIVREIKEYINLQKEFVRLDLISKLTIMLSALIVGALLFVMGMMVILFLAIAGGTLLGDWLGSTALGYALVSLLLIVMAVVVYCSRRRLFVRPITRFLSNLFFSNNK